MGVDYSGFEKVVVIHMICLLYYAFIGSAFGLSCDPYIAFNLVNLLSQLSAFT